MKGADVWPKHELIKAARKAHGISQDEIASHLGVDRSYISRLESGERALTSDIVKDIKRAIEFLKDLPRRKTGPKPKIQWDQVTFPISIDLYSALVGMSIELGDTKSDVKHINKKDIIARAILEVVLNTPASDEKLNKRVIRRLEAHFALIIPF